MGDARHEARGAGNGERGRDACCVSGRKSALPQVCESEPDVWEEKQDGWEVLSCFVREHLVGMRSQEEPKIDVPQIPVYFADCFIPLRYSL